MSVVVELSVTGLREQLMAFERLQKKIGGNLEEFWDIILTETGRVIEEIFTSEGSLGGSGAWEPLNVNYAKQKERRNSGRSILRFSDRLFDSYVFGGPERQVKRTKNRLIISSTVPYAEFHQQGTRTMPERSIILSEKHEKEIGIKLQKQMLEWIKGSGL